MFGSEFVAKVDRQCQEVPERVVFCNSAGEQLTYGELRERSNALACWLADERNVDAGVPVILYGMAIGLFAMLCGIGIRADLKNPKVHWVIEGSNVLCQLFVAIATLILFSR